MDKIIYHYDIYSVTRENGKTIVKILAFFYENDDHISLVEFCWLDFDIEDFKRKYEQDNTYLEQLEENAKQYQEDFYDYNKALEVFNYFNPKPLLITDVNENTEEGIYIDVNFLP